MFDSFSIEFGLFFTQCPSIQLMSIALINESICRDYTVYVMRDYGQYDTRASHTS
jgi:hypothetical protein